MKGIQLKDGYLVVDMILFCPECGHQHIDEEEGGFVHDEHGNAVGDPIISWANPAHRSHLCCRCKCIWRPSDVHTNGVREITSKGVNDSQPAVRDQLFKSLFEL